MGPRGQASVVLSTVSQLFVYRISDSLSFAVSMITCNISTSDISAFQFADRIFRIVSLSMIADLTTSYHLSLGLPTLLCPAHTLLPLGCTDIVFISSSSGALSRCANKVMCCCCSFLDSLMITLFVL